MSFIDNRHSTEQTLKKVWFNNPTWKPVFVSWCFAEVEDSWLLAAACPFFIFWRRFPFRLELSSLESRPPMLTPRPHSTQTVNFQCPPLLPLQTSASGYPSMPPKSVIISGIMASANGFVSIDKGVWLFSPSSDTHIALVQIAQKNEQ